MVRQAALSAGLDSLARVKVPEPSNLAQFVGSKSVLIALGKSLFWDMQVGSDGQACASCHFNGGADSRSKGQLNPGTLGGNTAFGSSGVAGSDGHANFSPSTQLTVDDFPFHKGGTDTNNVVSSQGVFNGTFAGVSGNAQDVAKTPIPVDPVFNVAGVNTRRVAPRNAPSPINSVFNVQQFWDGKGQTGFNGVNPNGSLDTAAGVWVDKNGPSTPPVKVKVSLPQSSLASLAAAVPTNNVTMSFTGRNLNQIGQKMLGLTPLGLQLVNPSDSVLGSMSKATLSANGTVSGARGLNVSYSDLIKQAFLASYWDSTQPVTLAIGPVPQMVANFPLFFGLAVQSYEATLVSGQSPFDKFMEGDNKALNSDQLLGLLTFVNTGQNDPAVSGVAQGNCVACHSGPEFTAAAFTTMDKTGPISIRPMVGSDGKLKVGSATAYFDNGFANIGVRPTAEDPGRGGTIAPAGQPKPVPMSFVRQALAGLAFAPALPACGASGQPVCPVNGADGVQGALKIPGLRNVELTGPYFHNGGQATLKQAVEFYHNLDFSAANAANLDPRIAGVHIGGGGDVTLLVSFLQSLTDSRVSNESGVFDHPQLFLPNGPGADKTLSCVSSLASCGGIEVPAVGSQGRSAAGIAPVGTFLGLNPQSN